VLVQIGPHKSSDLPDVPLMTELATTEDGKRLAELFTSPEIIGKPTVVGPRVAIERVEVLRKAYADTMKDSAFLADAKQAGVNVSRSAAPLSPQPCASFSTRRKMSSTRHAPR
jgi:hypothetical protein